MKTLTQNLFGKKNFLYAALAAVALSSNIALTSCSDDNEEDKQINNENVVNNDAEALSL